MVHYLQHTVLRRIGAVSGVCQPDPDFVKPDLGFDPMPPDDPW